MILYSVQCGAGHVFDEWFSNSADYDTRAAAGDITCPDCGDTHVTKAIMAPSVGKSAQPEHAGCGAGSCQGGCPYAGGF
ncbi:MAG: DUF1178 family protein [Telmatospirillum sp.]|nr:DUF1178 family protein [Telmatospirillum sp.]